MSIGQHHVGQRCALARRGEGHRRDRDPSHRRDQLIQLHEARGHLPSAAEHLEPNKPAQSENLIHAIDNDIVSLISMRNVVSKADNILVAVATDELTSSDELVDEEEEERRRIKEETRAQNTQTTAWIVTVIFALVTAIARLVLTDLGAGAVLPIQVSR